MYKLNIYIYIFLDIVLGQGAFGKVMRAEATGLRESEEHTLVAVKMVKGQKVQHFHVLVFLVSLEAIILVSSSLFKRLAHRAPSGPIGDLVLVPRVCAIV